MGRGMEMKGRNKIVLVAIILMGIISFGNIFGLPIAGISVILGIVFFFVNKSMSHEIFVGSGLDIKAIPSDFRGKRIWFWLVAPLMMNVVCVAIGKLFVPGYIEHVIGRTGILLTMDQLVLLVVQLVVFALGEEIAWRGFFQQQVGKILPIMPALILTSILFGIGHVTSGSLEIVVFDIVFVGINSMLYGTVFHKTHNVWMSAIAHFIANLGGIMILLALAR